MKYYLFDREYKIIHFEDMGNLEHGVEIVGTVPVTMSKNEVYILQIAALSDTDDTIKSVECKSKKVKIQCINTDVIDKFGESKNQSVKIKKNILQPLFLTVEADNVAENQKVSVKVVTESGSDTLDFVFKINDSRVANHGYNDLWRLSRLKWLNSTLAQNDDLVKPYTPVEVDGKTVSILGRDIELGKNGLINQVCSKFDEAVELCDSAQKELFAKPIEFTIDGENLKDGIFKIKKYKNRAEVSSKSANLRYSAEVSGVIRYDGQADYSVKITPLKDFTVKNIALTLFINKDCTSLMHGLGHRASKAENLTFKWDNDKQQDCVYMGSVNCGVRVKYKAENYIRPLINIFYKNLPLNTPTTTWDNDTKGDVKTEVFENYAKIVAETGEFEFKKGEAKSFDFQFHFTPFKPFDYKKAFSVRYDHNSKLTDEYKEIDRAAKHGLNYVTFHQGNMIMPYINYPFYEVDRLKKAVQYADYKNIGIKLYYTEREHSNHMAETFAYKALGDEIILRKQGVSHSWQKEKPQWLVDNFGEDIIPGWFVKYNKGKYKGEHDFSFIVRPDTRLDNYYIEGLNWLLENVGIKGIYIDDTSLDRTTLERAKKLLDKKGGLIDMHMWNHEEPRAGDVSCLNLYAELLPFLDSSWLGEGFFYKKYTPEYMLSEVSGIPYGVPGQMLQDGGDLYEGMLYAMNNRYGWGYTNAVDMYKLWDEFIIEDSQMLGYWHSKNPITTDNENVFTTVYLKGDSALLCVYNFSQKAEKFAFGINKDLLGFEPKTVQKIKFGSNIKQKADILQKQRLAKRSGAVYLLKV